MLTIKQRRVRSNTVNQYTKMSTLEHIITSLVRRNLEVVYHHHILNLSQNICSTCDFLMVNIF